MPCDVCHGARFNRETLQVKLKGKSIADVLDTTVEEGVEFFAAFPKIQNKLRTLMDVGLGYVRIGQRAHFIGGVAQRVKMARNSHGRKREKTLYVAG